MGMKRRADERNTWRRVHFYLPARVPYQRVTCAHADPPRSVPLGQRAVAGAAAQADNQADVTGHAMGEERENKQRACSRSSSSIYSVGIQFGLGGDDDDGDAARA